ncbi:hypothetical protein LTR91_007772 [Friedmanniomyces endolithicus]|uniref:WSC domain-containing protein n=1 Tax=Friedmanniomyces endolithicus TaxID=329885 RepID=A0AAN6FM76_9PEZI|nr:hypothetical protein LTR35_008628 [Friedmanniomyces endolithicus]KAK0287905.1 hypothetical protein LTS00_009750 [Friedmanniomyces endolithicus]KAK0320818.1 hypothetical protein LTR82_008136 [Friedmanniomyces endolithicus]KAK0828072.1 hypothetical protein LTR73_005025 [Friedmanniomyces endolithicus]KAK0919095.1 hypothetical protein LTR57_011005 [Friedmanniomyces endolithicus]
MVPFRLMAAWLAWSIVSVQAQGDSLSQQYCSNENTGSNYQAVYNIYQSNGACHDQCKDNYAFAVVQWQDCWCSNYIPAEQQSISNCNQNCPGYPSEQCGNQSAGLYGYIQLYRHPSGTAGGLASTQASSTTPSSTTTQPSTQQSSTPPATSTTQQPSTQQTTASSQPPATSIVSQTVYQTVTQSQSASVVVSYVTPSPTSTSASSPSSSSSSDPPSSLTTTSSDLSTSSALSTSSSTNPPVVAPVPAITQTSSTPPPQSATPVTSLRVVTLSGAIVTQTVTSTPFPAPSSAADLQSLQRNHLSPSAIAGVVIGTLLALALLLILAFLLLRRRKQHRDSELAAAGITHAGGPTSPRRNISVLSRTGLLSRGGRPTSMSESPNYYHDDAGGAALGLHTGGQNSVRHSMLFGGGGGVAGAGGVSPVSPLGSTHDEHDGSRRYSRPMVYDQRLNPSALFANAEGNGSRVSMQDQRDYSRPLGVANPDVEVGRGSFESRVS